MLIEERFRARDKALTDTRAKRHVDLVCVDGAGDNDPGWLVDLMTGYLAETRALRVELLSLELALANDMPAKDMLKAKRAHDVARKKLSIKINALRSSQLPQPVVDSIRVGLAALADLDRAEGFHRPKRKQADDADA
jgi:hypothetical protein